MAEAQPRVLGDFDIIVVGAGTAGCLLANRLSADPRCRVLLLEAGGRDDYVWVHVPVGYLYCIGNPRTDWLFETTAQRGLAGRRLKYPRGRVWGGCSSINGMIYMRGQAQDYEGWKARGNPGWGWDEVLPVFRQHEDYQGNDADPSGALERFHGRGGEWRVERQRVRWDILDAFRDAACSLGIPALHDFNCGDNEGCGYFEVNQRKGVRWNATKAFLAPALARPNLMVVSQAVVDTLAFDPVEPRRVSGVRFRTRSQREALKGREVLSEPTLARCRGEVVLAAGAIGSVQIMERSGVGQTRRLRALGISPRAQLQGVGENLQDHLQLRLIYKVSGTATLNVQARHWWGKALMGLQYLLFRTGPLTMSPSQMGVFTRSAPGIDRANLEYHVQPLSLDRFGEPLHPFGAFTASVCNLRPSSRGSVHINSAECRAPRPLTRSTCRPTRIGRWQPTRFASHGGSLGPMRCRGTVRRNTCRAASTRARRRSSRLPAGLGPQSFIRWGRCAWGPPRTRARLWTRDFGVTNWRGCVWRMPRSCPRSPRGTPTRPRS